MKRRTPAHWFRSVALLFALVLAQTAAAGHIDLDDSHLAGDTCTICFAAAHFAGGNVAAVTGFAVQSVGSLPVHDVPSQILPVRIESRLARGPPEAS